MALFEGFKDKFNTAAKSVKEMARDNIEISKISVEAKNLNARIDTLYGELGRKYYLSDGKDEAIPAICAQLKELHERHAELDRQRMQLKNQNRCPNCGRAMKDDARFCSGCGARMPEIAADGEEETAPEASTLMHFCVRCGAMLEDENAPCPNCSRSDAEEAAAEEISASEADDNPADAGEAE